MTVGCLVQLSHGDAYASVCSRGDLNAKLPLGKGCFDSKITNHALASSLCSWVVNGPTHGVSPHLCDQIWSALCLCLCMPLFS